MDDHKIEPNSSNSKFPPGKDLNLYLIFVITSFAVMGVASITPAFPQIIKHYHLTAEQIGYLITAFTLPGIFLSPFMGIFADRYGRKTILIPAILLFGVAGFLCAFQTTYQNLLMLRLFQGIGAAPLGSLNVTIIGDLYESKKRIRVMGYNASVLSISVAVFPAAGGLLASLGWRYVFYLPALAVPFAAVVLFRLHTPRVRNSVSLKKYLGNVWKIINNKKVWGLFLVNIMAFIILYGAYLSFFPLLLANRFHANSVIIGMTMSLMSLTTAFCSSQLGRVSKKISLQNLLYFSSLFYSLSLLILAYASSWSVLIFGVVLFGIAHGFFIPNIQTILVGFAPLSERAAFMSLNSVVLRIGQTLGPIVVALFYLNKTLQPVFLITAIFGFLMIVVIKIMVGTVEH